jgi:hypothetical protein
VGMTERNGDCGWRVRERESSKHIGGRDDSQSRFHVPLKEKDRDTSSHVGQVTRCDSSRPFYIMFTIEGSGLTPGYLCSHCRSATDVT